MDISKKLLLEGISDEIKKQSKTLQSLANQVQEKDNFVSLYEILCSNTYPHENKEDIALKLLTDNLSEDFFQHSKSKSWVYGVMFYNNKYQVTFPISADKTIFIDCIDVINPESFYEPISKGSLEFAELIEAYLEKKSLANLKALVRFSDGEEFVSPIRYYNASKEYSEKILREIRDKEKTHRIAIDNRHIQVRESREFINSVPSLQLFEKEGWNINFNNKPLTELFVNQGIQS